MILKSPEGSFQIKYVCMYVCMYVRTYVRMVGKMKTTRWRKIFVLQVFARNFAKIEHPKSQKDYKIGSKDLQR